MPDLHFSSWPKGVPRSLVLPETSVWDNLDISARRFSAKPAIIYYGTSVSYAELSSDVERLAGFLVHDLKARKADRVLLYMQNCPQWIIAYYAVLRAGAVVVPVNPMSKAEELRYIAEDSGARIAVCAQELLGLAEPLLAQRQLEHAIAVTYGDFIRQPTDLLLPDAVAAPRADRAGRGVIHWQDALGAGRAAGPHAVRPDDWCVIPYSSGTTGVPKGCLHTHRSVNANVFANVNWNPTPPSSVWLASLPLFHGTGMQNTMNLPIYHGATMVLMTRWDARVALRLIERYRVTYWRPITAMVIDFMSDPELERFDLSSLAYVGGGGAQMPEAVAQRLKALTGLDYIEGYGLSETSAATHINPPHRPKRQCLGVPLFDVDSRIVDPESLAELGPREVGEIVLSAPQLFLGYWNRPEATVAACFERDGKRFFRTGDLGYYDEEGYFFLVDRLKRMINASGYKVWPAEVEALMHAHPAIKEACVIGVPDAKRGETVKAVVVPQEGTSTPSADDIIAWCREHMAAYKVPRIVAFAASLPRSAAGKVQWRLLQEQERAKEVPA